MNTIGNGPILRLEDIHKDFSGLKVLTGVNLTVRKGERRAIIGPNGAGKTTLFNIISGRFPPFLGIYVLQGHGRHWKAPVRPEQDGHRTLFPDHQRFPRT